MRLNRWARLLLFGMVIPGLGYLAVHFALLDRSPVSPLAARGLDPSNFDVDTISPSLAKELGLRTKRPATEVVAVVISSTFCRANGFEGFHDAVAEIPSLLEAHVASRPEMVSRVIGISLDHDPETGANYLFGLADFDEVTAGGNWLNTATEKFLWGSFSLQAEIPQIVLLQRTVIWQDESSAVLEQEEVLKTIVGAEEIVEWVAHGAPMRAPSTAPAEDEVALLP